MEICFILTSIILSVLVAGAVSIIKRWLSKNDEFTKLTANNGKRAIYDGEFSKGVHDHLYVMGLAMVSNAIIVESSTSLSSRDVWIALVMLAKRFPMLRMKFQWVTESETGKTHRYLTEMDNPYDVEYSEEDLDAELWPRRLEEELHQPFDGIVGPLWRVIRLKEQYDDVEEKSRNTLLFTYHHSISDAISMMALFDHFFEYLDGADSDAEVESMEALPPLSDLIKHETTLSWWDACLFKLKWACLMKPQPAKNIYLQAFPPVKKTNPSIAKKTCIIPRNLTNGETLQLIQNCKANGCTVTGAFMAASAIALGKIIQGGQIKSPLTLGMGTAVNIRDWCSPVVSREHIGCFVSFCLVTLHLAQIHCLKAVFWRSARQLSEMIKSGLKNKEHFTFYKMLKYDVCQPLEEFAKLSGDYENMGRRPLVDEFSNIGRFECKSKKHKLLGYHFSVAQHFCGALFGSNIVTVNGQLFHTLAYSSHVVSHSQAEEYIDSVYQILMEVCSR